MKKIFTLLFLFVAGQCALLAQTDKSLVFIDEAGNEVADGTTLTVNKVTEDIFGNYLNSGLYVKNTTGGNVNASLAYEIKEISNGMMQVCFPVNCTVKSKPGQYETPAGTLTAKDVKKNIQSEWMPDEHGIAIVTFQLKIYNDDNTFKANGPKVTVKFDYSETAGIGETEVETAKPVAYYAADGRRLTKMGRGLTIVKLSNGKSRKIIGK